VSNNFESDFFAKIIFSRPEVSYNPVEHHCEKNIKKLALKIISIKFMPSKTVKYQKQKRKP
jgi:hypothetical protein